MLLVKKVIAQCNTNINDLLDLTNLQKMLPDYEVMHGHEALSKINAGEISPKNVLVIQECNAKIARKLRNKGAIPFANYCWESQLYAYVFYSKLKKIAPKFKYRIYFKGMFDGLKNCEEKNNFIVFYPGISDFSSESINWKDREFLSMVVGNKFVEEQNVFPKLSLKFWKYLEWFFRLFFETKTKKFLQANELQDKRLELIEYFGSKGLLNLYGKGWNNLKELPSHWQNRLKNIIEKLNPNPVKNKLEAISKYKFNLTIENLRYEGYVTEKILEAMVAKTIPVYMGAPDITEYIPKGCFIDLRDFKTLDDLYEYMKNMTEHQAQEYLDCARDFLASDDAKKYTLQSYFKLLADLIKSNS